ncbi:MAG: hypothetical protein ACFE0Q_18170 [Anaerolineae bacterium]
MSLDFLTPELFDLLVIGNLALALILMAWRFSQDVRDHARQAHSQHRSSADDAQSPNDKE